MSSLLTSTKTPVLGKIMTTAARQLDRTGTNGSSREDFDLFSESRNNLDF